MKSIVIGLLAGAALFCLSAASSAEGVYVTKGKNGPVFSNVPQPGAKEIDLKPLNVIPPPVVVEPVELIAPVAPIAPIGASPAADGVAPEAPVEAQKAVKSTAVYSSFFVVYPENGGAVAANTAAFEVRLAVDPSLQLDQQHAFAIALNGQPVGQRFGSTEFLIPPSFWNDRLPPDNQTIQLDATIVDGEGKVVRQAEPVRFVMRHVTHLNHQRLPDSRSPKAPRHDPGPGAGINLPTSKPALEKPAGMVGPAADR